jgi:hypothetical protein
MGHHLGVALPMPPPPASRPPPQYGGRAPVVDPAELRPRRWWYGLAGAVAGLLAGAVAGVRAVLGLFQMTQLERFTTDEPFDVDLGPGEPTSIYVRQDDADTLPLVDCSAEASAGATIDLTEPDLTTTVLSDGDIWVAEYDVDVSASGTFTIECRGFESLEELELGIGPRADPLAIVDRNGPWMLVAAGLTGAGVAIGLVVGLRRTSHQRRLMAGRRAGPPG